MRRNLRDLEAWCNGRIGALAQASVLTAKVTGPVDATDLETTAPYESCGQVTRAPRVTDTRGEGHEIEVAGDGGVYSIHPEKPRGRDAYLSC